LLLRNPWPGIVVLGGAAIVLAVQALVKQPSEWQEVYVLAARQLLARENLYFPDTYYLYPPFMAAATVPFALVPPLVSRALWYAINVACIGALVRIAWRLAGGPGLAALRRDGGPEWIALLAGLLCGATYILNALAHQQTDIVIALLLVCGCACLLARRDVAAGLCLGVASACKATPLLWLPYLAWRRRWVAAGLVGATALALNLLPQLFGSPPEGGTWLARWVARFVAPTQDLGTMLGHWGRGDVIYNQSLGGTVQRLVNTALQPGAAGLQLVQRTVLAPLPLKLAVYSLLAGMVALSLVAAVRAQRRPGAASGGPAPAVFEFGVVLTLMLMLSPMSSQAHFVTLILPAFCLARRALQTGDRVLWAAVGGAAILTLATNKDLVGATAYDALLWSGSVTLSALLLWAGCIRALLAGSSVPGGTEVRAAA
jgi:hypothetical protein